MLGFCILEVTDLTNDRHHISNELLSFGVNITVYASIGLFDTSIESVYASIGLFDTSIEFLYRLLQDSYFTF